MKIGICDDDKIMREGIVKICRRILDENDVVADFYEFSDGKGVIDFGERLDLLILDIEMQEFNGIEVKEDLQHSGAETLIIFVTSHQNFVMQAFGKNVCGFVVKNKLQSQLPKILKTVLHTLEHFVELENGVNSKDILYVHSAQVYSELIQVNGERKLLRKSLSALESELSNADFVRVHREYLVNLYWVKEIGKGYMKINRESCHKHDIQGKEEIIPISVRLQATVNRKYRDYAKKNARYNR